MEVSLKVGCIPSAVGKQPSDLSLHAWMPEVSYLCGIRVRSLNEDDDVVKRHE